MTRDKQKVVFEGKTDEWGHTYYTVVKLVGRMEPRIGLQLTKEEVEKMLKNEPRDVTIEIIAAKRGK